MVILARANRCLSTVTMDNEQDGTLKKRAIPTDIPILLAGHSHNVTY